MLVAGIAVLTKGLSVVLRNNIRAGFLGVALVKIVDIGTEMKSLITN